MAIRIASGAIATLFLLFILAQPQPVPFVLITFLFLFCLYEFTLIVGFRTSAVIGGVLSLGVYVAYTLIFSSSLAVISLPRGLEIRLKQVFTDLGWLMVATIFIFALLTSFAIIQCVFRGRSRLGGITVVLIMIFLLTFPFVILALMSEAGRASMPLLVVLGLTWVGDTSAFFGGRFFGKNLLAPRLSPNKTWEGVASAIAGTVVYILALGYITMRELSPAILTETLNKIIPESIVALIVFAISFGVLTTFIGLLGDLTVSGVKRLYHKKDTGTFLPGHGGLWDRVDSLLFIAPWSALVALFFKNLM